MQLRGVPQTGEEFRSLPRVSFAIDSGSLEPFDAATNSHHTFRRHGAKVKRCTHEGCPNQLVSKGFCVRHLQARGLGKGRSREQIY